MINLLWENLKIYKFSYLFSVIAVSLGMLFLIIFKSIDNAFFNFALVIIICIPEFRRISEIYNSGYFRLVGRLPISSSDIYRHKYLISISGIVLIYSLVSIFNIFIILPEYFFKLLMIFSSNIIVGIIVYNNTKLHNSPVQESFRRNNVIGFISAFILLLYQFFLYNFINSEENILLGSKLIPYNYLIFLFIQVVSSYFFGKFYYNILVRTKLNKSYI